ncbi:RNA-binding transcriptional accessory protein [Peribacillus psychrosaccharolyticus]|uniref:RNA-binding transcriptional accessory protein n=1 Tax=Peribacillus psychrosaccharolyticus TaxID=1407 RepID=A0A974RZU8_PERPY|nr:Tex family protein [Peribacillus psychrosaccharolyticus]MEC2058000.1 Tex family protein [Peribacillus psychrosaccharolyticus]MED3745391.1 Tex family protein [Peribacillus psychrosaccharolyticus]QQS98614.1 RNA-binding transcriptional accessory protein [Peribacillus psychrosaccharolyticus]
MVAEENQLKEIIKQVVKELNLTVNQVQSVINLLNEGNTVPFIARYRKEMTGSLDEVEIRSIMDRWKYLENLHHRKEEVVRIIEEQGKLTPELKAQIEKSVKLQEIEDLYRPYKQKRRTKATVAKEKGLEPLAEWLMKFHPESVLSKAEEFVSTDLDVLTAEDAVAGAKDIIAEQISDDAALRKWIRADVFKTGKIMSVSKNEDADEKKIFEMYYEYEEPVQKIVPHRVLALNRGEKEEILRVSIEPKEEAILEYMVRKIINKNDSKSAGFVTEAIEDSFKRLIFPSIEREIRKELTEKAEDQAIHIFSENLRNLLLQPPLKGKVILALDPAFRTGCKLAVLDETGKVIDISVIYPHAPINKKADAREKTISLIEQFNVEVVAIGNGTASRESEQFIADILKDLQRNTSYIIVNEAGASIYSASEIARDEFPDLQVEQRSAVSIGRRLQDPLAELVKIDPQSVGVGQYQHDVSQKKLAESLTFVVETAVNQVGVNVNTASPSLLQYVAGLSKTVAQNIVKKREEEGKFESRKQLKHIPRLGAKTYEQSIGFMRIIDGTEPLDQTSIHPENYSAVNELLKKLGSTKAELGSEALIQSLKNIDVKAYSEELGIGEITLKDIIEALMKPGRDPRDELPKPLLKKDVLKMEDLQKGMELQGTVRNVVDFGAFVDIGVKQDGLVHISKLSTRFVKHPLDLVSVGDVVTVWVEQVDVNKQRVSLTMLEPKEQTM